MENRDISLYEADGAEFTERIFTQLREFEENGQISGLFQRIPELQHLKFKYDGYRPLSD